MKKPILFILILTLMAFSGLVMAQDDTTDTTTSTDAGDSSSVSWYFVACETSAVVDLSGFMEAGYDIYVQIFREIGTANTALTPLTQVSVSGDYQVSPQINYTGGEILATGQFATAEIRIAREGSPETIAFSGTVNDTQDGCISPSYGSADTTTADGDSSVGLTAGELAQIYSPFGGIINSNIVSELPNESIVELGARASLNPFYGQQRSDTYGQIFAECDRYPGSEPGLLYDTDSLTIFWSWYASTPELVEDHLREARYQVWLNSENYPSQNIIDYAARSPIQQREDGNYWVFYTISLGDRWAPGEYSVGYRVEWANNISDGYEEFGPTTANNFLEGSCQFQVSGNPYGVDEPYQNPNYPLNLG
ncbi:MAG: hypothetical protein CL607_20935 [Anaerolineaceae bacterium]|nr:hypothetical protein [Anaerolineaceae bacterium]